MIKNKRIVTPAGVAQYPHLIKPDTKFNELGEYKVNLIVGADEAKPLIAELEKSLQDSITLAQEKAKGKKINTARPPYDLEVDAEGNETGNYVFKFKAKANIVTKTGETFKQKVVIVDAKGKPFTPTALWGGSTIKVSAEVIPYFTAMVGAGISLRLKAVQVIKLVEGSSSGGNKFGFGTEEGFEAVEETTATEFETSDAEENADF